MEAEVNWRGKIQRTPIHILLKLWKDQTINNYSCNSSVFMFIMYFKWRFLTSWHKCKKHGVEISGLLCEWTLLPRLISLISVHDLKGRIPSIPQLFSWFSVNMNTLQSEKVLQMEEKEGAHSGSCISFSRNRERYQNGLKKRKNLQRERWVRVLGLGKKEI